MSGVPDVWEKPTLGVATHQSRHQRHAMSDAQKPLHRTTEPGWVCGARRQGTAGGNDPADCDWPTCGCDPYANKVIEALEEIGALKDR